MRRTRAFYISRSIIITAIIYLVLIFSLAFTHIYRPIPDEEAGVFVELEDLPTVLPPQTENLENLSQQERHNIAVNKAMQDRDKTDPYDYSDIDKADENYKEQLVKNAIGDDQYKKIFEREYMNIDDNIDDRKKENQDNNEQHNQPSNYQGATYISYFLKDRYKMKIPVPTYKCETSGKIVMNIVVNQDGKVVSHEVDPSSNQDDCLIKAAIQSVERSKFNQNYSAPSRQRGTITYIFESQ
ncbi:MAG: hypothetical protein JXR60_05805 [Bacteroidales bacterium]|nr:hypothetical protein [Bacteroidales bacterium]